VRADDDIYLARFEGGENLFLLGGGSKAAEPSRYEPERRRSGA